MREPGSWRRRRARGAALAGLAAVALVWGCRDEPPEAPEPVWTVPRPLEEVVLGPEGLAQATVDPASDVAVDGHYHEVLASQWETYAEARPKTALELQPLRSTCTMPIHTAAGREGVATLVDLQPAVDRWYVLRLEWVGGGDPEAYHLENPYPGEQRIDLDGGGQGLLVVRDGEPAPCELWGEGPPSVLGQARSERWPFEWLCDERVLLRTATVGRRTKKEMAADFLRDHVWGGEKITTVTRDTVFAGSYRKEGVLADQRAGVVAGGTGTPRPPVLEAAAADRLLEPMGLGLSVDRETGGELAQGRWYELTGAPGVFVSALRPDAVAREIVDRQAPYVAQLDSKERSALVYVVAFDLARHDLGFALGTDHPRVGWSERAGAAVRDPALPGPDGIGTVSPLVRTGMLDPVQAERVVATFTGGYKRSHGAFKSGALSKVNGGSHYGFIEQGAVLSKLQPGLSTLAVDLDGAVSLGTWTAEQDAGLARIRHARQNGVPLLERDAASGEVRPGALVTRWGEGNWSGSEDKKLRTLRAGTCLQDGPEGSFLLYGYFSAATPSAMARVFEAYGCEHAMMLDMNALEHTYLAVYRVEQGELVVEHLIDEMDVLDEVVDGKPVPRFVGFPDNRDFFYVTREVEP